MVQRRIVPTMSCFGQFILWRSLFLNDFWGIKKFGIWVFGAGLAITNLINNVFRVFCNRLCFSCTIMTGKRGMGEGIGRYCQRVALMVSARVNYGTVHLDDCCKRDTKPGSADWRSVAEV
jgi:hypothetical protein